MDKKIELLSPAGDPERLDMALAYGADAVYLAGSDFGMRTFAGNFGVDELERAVALCHAAGKKVHVTCNTMPRNDEAARLPEFLECLASLGADAVIVADLGVFRMAERYAPNVHRHISTQMGVTNFDSARAWYDLGASRVILARELCLDEVRELRAKTPKELELEAFVHGSMCVSYSGRCVLSNYMTGRDAARGSCSQPCRYEYALMERSRTGEYFPVYEEGGEAYVLNAKDLCMIEHIPALLNAGLDSLKIEGRAKSAYYSAVVTAAYRHAVDAAVAGASLAQDWRDEVQKVSHRHYGTGFYFGAPEQFTEHARYLRECQVVAVVVSCAEDGLATLSLRNKFAVGDEVELMTPDGAPQKLTVTALWDALDQPLLEPRNPEMTFQMRLPRKVPPLSMLRIERENS